MFFDTDLSPSQSDLEALSNGLSHHASEFVDEPGFKPIAVFLRDKEMLVGGVSGVLNWNWFYVSLLWVASELRGAGHGRELMKRIERAAVDQGCTHSHLDTFSFQSNSFYESIGYEVFATLEDYPPGFRRFFMKKALG